MNKNLKNSSLVSPGDVFSPSIWFSAVNPQGLSSLRRGMSARVSFLFLLHPARKVFERRTQNIALLQYTTGT